MAAAIAKENPCIFSFVEPFTCYRSINSRSDISIIGRDVASRTRPKIWKSQKSAKYVYFGGLQQRPRKKIQKSFIAVFSSWILLQRRIERISSACCILPGDLAKYCRQVQIARYRTISQLWQFLEGGVSRPDLDFSGICTTVDTLWMSLICRGRFFDLATPISYSTSNTSECLSLTVTEF